MLHLLYRYLRPLSTPSLFVLFAVNFGLVGWWTIQVYLTNVLWGGIHVHMYILKKHPMANLKHLSSLHMGLSETGESRNSLANHHVRSQMAMLWHVVPFWKYTQSSDTMHCSCCTTRTHWSGICIYIYICTHVIYIYIIYTLKFSNITIHTHYHSSISLKPLSYLIHILFISHVYTIPWICHEIPWQKKQDGTLSQSDLLGALDLASNSLAPSGTPRVPARSWVKIWRFVAHISYVPESWQCSTKISSCLTDELIFWLAWFTKIDETHKNSVRGIRGHFPFPCLIGGSLPV